MLKLGKNKAAVTGLFMLLALFLLICFLMALAGGKLFVTPTYYTAYFDKSVRGLQVGSPVMFRGVRVGQVSDIHLTEVEVERRDGDKPEKASLLIEVTLELIPETLRTKVNMSSRNPSTFLNRLGSKQEVDLWLREMIIHRGLRLRLQSLSFLTGQLYIEMDFFQDGELTHEQVSALKSHGVIPTRMSALERLQASVEHSKSGERMAAFNKTVSIISQFVLSGKADEMLESFHAIMRNLREASGKVPELAEETKTAIARLNQVAEQARETMDAVRTMIADADDAVRDAKEALLSPKTREIVENVHEASRKLDGTMAEARGLLETARSTMEPGAEALHRLDSTLKELERAAEALRSLADTIQRNPESILKGR